MPDPALQKRGGNNAGPGPVLFYDGDKATADIVKVLANQDNLLAEGVEGKVRVCAVAACLCLGQLFNRNGDGVTPVDCDVVFIDAQGNEIIYQTGISIFGVEPGPPWPNNAWITTPNSACGVFSLIKGEKIVLRVTGGNPALGDGVYYVPLAIHEAHTARAPRTYITNQNRTVIAEPPPGKLWQMPITTIYPCGAGIVGINFDAVNAKIFDCYLVNGETGVEVKLSAADPVPPSVPLPPPPNTGNLFSDIVASHMIPHPYRLEVEEISGNPFAGPLLISSLFIEFDLPKELG